MVRRTVPALAAAAAAALLLAGCGSSDDKKDDEIPGAGKASHSSSAKPATKAPADPDAPKVNFPKDFTLVTEWEAPTDAKQAAVLESAMGYVRGIKHGIIEQEPKDPAYLYFSSPLGDTQSYAQEQIDKHVKGGWTLTGTDRYTRPEVRVAEDGKRASVTFCEDQSKMFGKEVKSGKVLRTQPSDKDYYFFEIGMEPADKDTVWLARSVKVQGEATQCKA